MIKPFFLFPSHIFFLSHTLLFCCLGTGSACTSTTLCAFVVCAAVVRRFSNLMYYLFKLWNMSEASLFFAYGSKGQPLCLNSKVAFKYVSLNWNYIMLAMGLLLSAWEGKWKRLWSWPRAETQDKSHNSHTTGCCHILLFRKSVFSHLKSTCSAFSRQVLYQDCTSLGYMTFNMRAPSLISHLMWTSGLVISAQAWPRSLWHCRVSHLSF